MAARAAGIAALALDEAAAAAEVELVDEAEVAAEPDPAEGVALAMDDVADAVLDAALELAEVATAGAALTPEPVIVATVPDKPREERGIPLPIEV